MADGPLSGIKVVEWAHVHFGPGAGMFMSDMGADVVHVESREGDGMRHYATLWGNNFFVDGSRRNTFTEDLLRNKKSLTVDLKTDDGKQIVRRLVEDADVFLTNFRPAAATKLGLDYETLSAINPKLIYAQGTGYGSRGPDKDAPGLEMMGLAQGGMMLGSAVEGAEPVYPTMGTNDRLGAIGLLVAILSALLARERTGVAQLVQTSLLGWMINLQASAISCSANTGQAVRPLLRTDQDDPNYNVYQLGDETWIALGMTIHPHKYWPLLCEAIGRRRTRRRPALRDAGEATRELPGADRHLRRGLRSNDVGAMEGEGRRARVDLVPSERSPRPPPRRADPRERLPAEAPASRARRMVVRPDARPLREDSDQNPLGGSGDRTAHR